LAEPGLAAVHPQVRALLRAMGDISDPSASTPAEPTPAELAAERADYLDSAIRLGGAAEPVAAVEDVVIPAGDGARLPARVFTPLHAADTRDVLVWLHGGGWYVGDIPTFDRVGRALANASGAKVVLPEYRLAPEHRWPVPTDDARAILRWARGDGAQQLDVDGARVAVGGDSAGGHLAVVAARHACQDGLPPLRALLLVYPLLDPTSSSDAMREFEHGPMLTRADVERCWSFYRTPAARDDDPDFAPLVATDWAGMPPTRIAVAGHDPVRDDGLRLAVLLRDAGVAVQERNYTDMVHGFIRWGGVVDATGDLLRWLGAALR
jgi:acetyl esterase